MGRQKTGGTHGKIYQAGGEMNQVTNKQHVVILGGTGFIGSHLSPFLQAEGYEVQAYGREAFSSLANLCSLIEGSDVLIMLAGANIGERWTKAHKQAIWDSRLKTNTLLKQALQTVEIAPKRILAASAIGIYPQTDCATPWDESCERVDDSYLGKLGSAWEAASQALADQRQLDLTLLRFGVVLGNGGALSKMLPAFKWGLGGPVAGGQQCMSWIHIQDLCRAIAFVLQAPNPSAIYNLCSPLPVNNATFGKALASALRRPFWLPLPAWQLKWMFGEGAQVLTHSSAVLPSRLIQQDFSFDFADINHALEDLLSSLSQRERRSKHA